MLTLAEAFAAMPLVAILRGVRPDEVIGIAEAIHAEGISIVEVPLNSPSPLDSIARLQALRGQIVSGAGTVVTAADVDAVVAVGGQIIVAPNTDPAVIGRAIALGAVPMPGVATATEAFAALAAGACILKLFPAASYGPAHLKALGAVLPPDAVLLPVGGVGPAQMADWWAAGARGFGLGSDLYRPGMSPAEVGQRAAAAVAAMRALR
ncbi:MAG: 2-dehydro-3-deoxy-6-phosphogalactonate aldolase [Sandarakinorhabdus sp.]